MPRVYKPRGSPRASRMSRRSTVNAYRTTGRSAMYRSIRASNARVSRARSFGLKNARTGGLLEVETKFWDTAQDTLAITADTGMAGAEADPPIVLCLNGVPQGDTMSSRDGSKIAMKSIQIEGLCRVDFQINQTAADCPPVVTVALVLDTQTNKAQLNSEDVFSNPGTIAPSCALRNMSYTERFKVLKKKVLRFPSLPITYDGTNLEQAGVNIPFKMFVKLGGLQTKFDNSTTSGYCSTIIDNSLHLIAFADNTSTPSELSYNSRLRYVG